jgi:predicted nuclease of restriction endonuclease-like (RecB) superfamily
MSNAVLDTKEYGKWLARIKGRIQATQIKAAVAVNRELLALYWDIGKMIVEKQENAGWGDFVLEHVARDLKKEFPGLKGFSRRNLLYMRKWYIFYSPLSKKVPQLVAQSPWGHNRLILDKIKKPEHALFYLEKTAEHNWSRDVLRHQIEAGLHRRQGKAVSNFHRVLPAPDSDLAVQTLKDPYIFDFLTLDKEAREKDLENQLIANITRFLLELGGGFAFVGRQYNLEVSRKDFFIDLLFYHLKLRCYVVIDLKIGEFKPEFVGKMNFYLSAVDDRLKTSEDRPSIGIILCKTKDKAIAEYALRDMNKPVGISEYRLTRAMPKELRSTLPTIEELEAELMSGTPTRST